MARPNKSATQRGSEVNKQALADLLGVSTPTIDQWVRAGCPIVQRGAKGVAAIFNTADVSRWRIDKAAEDAGGGAKADESELKLRKLAAEAGKAELELAKARGEVAPVADFERATSAMMASIRANMRNVPGRSVLQLLGCTDEKEFKRILMAEIDLALSAAATEEIDFEGEDMEFSEEE